MSPGRSGGNINLQTKSNHLKRYLIRSIPVLLWASIIFWGSTLSNPYALLKLDFASAKVIPPAQTSLEDSSSTKPGKKETIGRFVHVGEYAILEILMLVAVVWKNPIRIDRVLVGTVASLAFAFSDEIHQLFVPFRTFEWFDLFIDLLGILLGFSIFMIIKLRYRIFTDNKKLLSTG